MSGGCQWITPVILLLRRITVQSQPRKIVCETLISKKLITKKGLVEWLKV
jgi:hypothetical protein